jgi:ribosomal 50S subunit-associated protein YjgA (DUF615 family)
VIPLDEQKAKLDRLLDERITHYRRGVKKGTLALEAASAKHAECEAIRASFAFLVRNQVWIREEFLRRRAMAEQIAIMDQDPAVQAVRRAFPEAEVTAVRKITREATAT